MIDYSLILVRKFSDCLWNLNGDDYEGLVWLSDLPKPSKNELDSLWNEVQLEIATEAETKATAKAELLQRLGITEDEAKLLLA